MNLIGLHSLIKDTDEYLQLTRDAGSQAESIVAIDTAKPLLLACLHHDLGVPMLIVTPNAREAKRLHERLISWCAPNSRVHLFPELDVLPYEHLTPDSSIVEQRLRVLALLSEWNKLSFASPPLIVTSAHALSQKTVAVTDFASACLAVKKGMRTNLNQLLAQWVGIGYDVTETVETPGTVSKRGGIIDVYSPNNDYPARIEFFGDEVESIRWFDPATQRSVGLADSLTIIPAREMLSPNREQIETAFDRLDLSNCSDQTRDAIREDVEFLRNGQWRDGLQFYAALFNSGFLTDYLPLQSVVALNDPESITAELADLESQALGLRQSQIERSELPRSFPQPYFGWSELKGSFARIERSLVLKKWEDASPNSFSGFRTATPYAGQIPRFLDDAEQALRQGNRLVVVSQQANRLAELLGERDIMAVPVSELEQVPPKGSITLVQGTMAGGWILNETILLTDSELFGFVKKRRPVPRRHAPHEAFLSDLSIGDYVVHIDHGIARFIGVINMAADGTEREYLILEYAEDDKLYVPSDQVDRVTLYVGSGGYVPALSRLNTQEWTRTKQRVKKAADDLAKELLVIYASREISEGLAFGADTLWQQELEASFPYEETFDQLETIRAVKADMESPRPMDRLVCGDVGYGKTEVAVRAAFKAVADGMQVGVLVPTTVLAQQHFVTFTQRLAAFPTTIEVLSRFRSHKEQQDVIGRLANGSVDICIGTHRLIQKDVVFNNLGLVIIDEEQKFGVAHKERLKQFRSEVDVLTLSATPIPRSLHMSLVGVRDMSTIETPPEERLPIKTYVAEYDDELVREAILRELDRNGQVFFVHNRVRSIAFVASQVSDLVPEARVAFAHGQMPEEVLESAMLDFIDGKIDVLVCTTIVESGLDLPNANTLIINDSDKLGLTQLYHLRGRVGRGDVRAYAYLLYEKGKRLTDLAQKRLKTIFEATELGAGFRIAMKDLEIRGAGNILGPEQSGHVGAVGFDLYCRLLSGAVEELKSGDGTQAGHSDFPTVDLPITACIPEQYVPDLNTRLALYQRLAKLESLDQIKDVQQELKDRFGEIPVALQNLLFMVSIKLLSFEAGIRKIFTEDKRIVMILGNQKEIDRISLQRSFGSSLKVGATQVRLDMRQLGKHWQRILEEVLRAMARKK